MVCFLQHCYVFTFFLGCAFGLQSLPHTQRFASLVSFSRLSSTSTSSERAPATSSGSIEESNSSQQPPKDKKVDFRSYGNGYKTVFSELPFAECNASSGSIPIDLKGSYFRCGPGTKKRYYHRLMHSSI